jgi:pectate lyase
MKTLLLLQALLFSIPVFAQTNKGLPHGTTFGTKPDTTAIVSAVKLESFMAQKTRITIAVKGHVLKVTKQKGGWFELDAGNGKVIAAHFKNYTTNIPADLTGHTVIVAGVAQKQFIADDRQHFAGDTVKGKKQHNVKANPKRRLTFEVTGLLVE